MTRQRETGQCLVAAAFGGIAALAVAGAATASAAWIMCMLLTALGGVLWASAPRPGEQEEHQRCRTEAAYNIHTSTTCQDCGRDVEWIQEAGKYRHV